MVRIPVPQTIDVLQLSCKDLQSVDYNRQSRCEARSNDIGAGPLFAFAPALLLRSDPDGAKRGGPSKAGAQRTPEDGIVAGPGQERPPSRECKENGSEKPERGNRGMAPGRGLRAFFG